MQPELTQAQLHRFRQALRDAAAVVDNGRNLSRPMSNALYFLLRATDKQAGVKRVPPVSRRDAALSPTTRV